MPGAGAESAGRLHGGSLPKFDAFDGHIDSEKACVPKRGKRSSCSRGALASQTRRRVCMASGLPSASSTAKVVQEFITAGGLKLYADVEALREAMSIVSICGVP